MFALPTAFRLIERRLGWRNFVFSLIPASVLLILIYGAASIHYYHGQIHPFDPFLQISPARFDVEPGRPPEGVYRVIVMGGSTTQFSVYPMKVTEILEGAKPDIEAEMLNAGVAWWTSKHSLVNYITYAEAFKPQLVIVMHAVNDLTRSCEPPDNSMGPYNDDWSHFYGPAINAAQPVTFERRLFLTYLGIVYYFYENNEVDYGVEHFRAIRPFRRHMARIVRYARLDGADVVVITQPSHFVDSVLGEAVRPNFASVFCKSDVGFMERVRPSGGSMRRAMDAFNQVTREVAQSEGALLLDAAATMNGEERFFYDDVHTTQLGGDTLGQAVAQFILDEGLVEKRLSAE